MPSHGSTREIRLTHQGRVGAAAKAAPGPSGRTPVGQQAHTQRVAIQAAAPGATVPPHVLAHQHFQNALAALHQVLSAYKSGANTKGLDIPPDIARLDVKIGHQQGYPPSLLAAQQLHESNFNPNAVSSAGAFGLSQFIPSTASEYGVKPGSSKQAEKSQVKGQAQYMKTLGAPRDTANALGRYLGDGNPNSSYAQGILADRGKYSQLDKPGKKPNPKNVRTLAKAGISAPAPSKSKKPAAAKRYVNPIPSKAWTQSRTDEGVDFAPKTSNAPIRALGDATYVGKGQGPGWQSGGGGGTGDGIVYKLKDAKGLPSSYVFAYEGLRADPHLTPGQKIKKGQIVGQGVQGGSIEIGFAKDASGAPLNQSTYSEGQVTQGGTQFQNLLAKLPGSSATKGNIMSFVSSGGGGSTGVAGFSSVTGVSQGAARKMTPQQRMMTLRKALGRTLAAYGGSSSSSHTSSAPLTHVPNKPAV